MRREFNRQQAAHPSYNYSEAQKKDLQAGRNPTPESRLGSKDPAGGSGPRTGEHVKGTPEGAEPPPEGAKPQLHHLEHRSSNPYRALDANNVVRAEGFKRGSSHHESHYGDGAKRLENWQRQVADGQRPNAVPPEHTGTVRPQAEGKAPEVKAPEVKAPGELSSGLRGIAEGVGKLFGAAGEVSMILDFARDLEFSNDRDNPKWGNEYHDMHGNSYYRQPDNTWTTTKDPWKA